MIRIFLTLIIAFFSFCTIAQNYEEKRERMVSNQIENRGIKDPEVIQAMRNVKRHEFVPEQFQDRAYSDRPLSIGYGQTISQPYIVAHMTELLNIEKGDKILEIGTGSGYQAAVLAEITPNVYTIEIVEELAERARKTLKEQEYQDIHTKVGDGYKGWEKHAPFDGIIVTCSPSDVPEPLKEQLAEGGRMVIPVGGALIQELVVLQKVHGDIKETHVSNVRFVPMVDDEGDRY